METWIQDTKSLLFISTGNYWSSRYWLRCNNYNNNHNNNNVYPIDTNKAQQYKTTSLKAVKFPATAAWSHFFLFYRSTIIATTTGVLDGTMTLPCSSWPLRPATRPGCPLSVWQVSLLPPGQNVSPRAGDATTHEQVSGRGHTDVQACTQYKIKNRSRRMTCTKHLHYSKHYQCSQTLGAQPVSKCL